jgi:hypothetical protein
MLILHLWNGTNICTCKILPFILNLPNHTLDLVSFLFLLQQCILKIQEVFLSRRKIMSQNYLTPRFKLTDFFTNIYSREQVFKSSPSNKSAVICCQFMGIRSAKVSVNASMRWRKTDTEIVNFWKQRS